MPSFTWIKTEHMTGEIIQIFSDSTKCQDDHTFHARVLSFYLSYKILSIIEMYSAKRKQNNELGKYSHS